MYSSKCLSVPDDFHCDADLEDWSKIDLWLKLTTLTGLIKINIFKIRLHKT